MEQESTQPPHNTEYAHESEASHPAEAFTEGRHVVVEASPGEIAALDALGPEDPAVQDWLAENGIGPNDTIGVGESVYTANPDDFLTRSREASEALAEAQITTIEEDIDGRTAEIAEEEPRITREEAEEIGGTAVGEVVEEPEALGEPEESVVPEESLALEESEEPEALEDGEAIDTAELAASLSRAAAYLESNNPAQLGNATILEGTRQSIAALGSALGHIHDYPPDAVRTLLQRTISQLEEVVGATGRFRGSLAEVGGVLAAVETSIDEQKQQAPESTVATAAEAQLADSLADVRREALLAEQQADTFGSVELSQGIQRLEEVMHQSRLRPINPDDIAVTLNDIRRRTLGGSPLDQAFRQLDGSLSTVRERLQATRSVTAEQAQAS